MTRRFEPQKGWLPASITACVVSALFMLGVLPARVSAQILQVTLSEAVGMFANNNLELQESRFRAAELSALARQAAAYPNPAGIVSHEPVWRKEESYSETYLSVSQELEWPGQRRARIDAAEEIAEAAYADLKADSLRLLFEVTEAYTKAVAADRRLEVLTVVTDLFRKADQANQLMLVEGEVSGYRAQRTRVERTRYENRLSLAELEAADTRRRLALLIAPNGEASQMHPADGFRELPSGLLFETVLRHAHAQRAELASAANHVEAANAALLAARRERLPEPTLTAGFKRQSDGFKGLSLGTTIPLPIFDRNAGNIEARRQQVAAAEASLALVEARIEQDVRRTYYLYASLSDRVERISRNVLGAADDLLHAARVGYVEGEMTLVELLDAAEAYRDARTSSLDLHASLQIAYFDLLRAAGGTIDNANFSSAN